MSKKRFEPITFDAATCRNQVDELIDFLDRHDELDEQNDIQPFFYSRKQLCAAIGLSSAYVKWPSRLQDELQLFGDFRCDLAIGDDLGNYCLVEFEDATPDSIFVQKGRATSYWAPRFETGYSQIVDWFWKMSDLEDSLTFKQTFRPVYNNCHGMLVIGRDSFLEGVESDRLRWRSDSMSCTFGTITCVTFDELARQLDSVLSSILASRGF
jgi:hypothetical protein